jgi:ADP-ribosylglycohydrolase
MSFIYERIYGCLAATRVASAMGACPEGRPRTEIQEKYGIVDDFYPYHHYANKTDWVHPAGSTEDGIERQKLICTAIIKKGDRITADDLVATWIEVCDPEKMVNMTEQFDRDLLSVAKSGIVKAGDLGNLCARYSHLNTTIRSFHALCMINAGDIPAMIQDLYDVGRVYQPLSSDAFSFGAAYNAAVVHAMTPDATVESVIETAIAYASPLVKIQIERDLSIAQKYNEPLDMVDEIHQNYTAKDALYDQSRAHETACKAIAIFAAAKGDVKKCTITAVNFGRDTDCLAASAAGLAGALRGIENVPSEWVAKVDEVTKDHPYTNSRLTMEETVDGLMEAFRNKTERMKRYVAFAESNS